MAEWTRERSEEQKKGPEPHPDCKANVEELYRKMKSAWMPNNDWESPQLENGTPFANWRVSDMVYESIYNPTNAKRETVERVLEYKNATFTWGKKWKFKHAHPVSFHQKQYDFSNELISVLNAITKELGYA